MPNPDYVSFKRIGGFGKRTDSLKVDTTLYNSTINTSNRLSLQRQPSFLKAVNDVRISRYRGNLDLIRFKLIILFNTNVGTFCSSAAPEEFTFFKQLNTNFGQYANVSLILPIYDKGQHKNAITINRLTTIITERQKELVLFELEQLLGI
ncbi:MAG: hypothetical protein ACI9V1_003307 [Spirosomataceae bacterium]